MSVTQGEVMVELDPTEAASALGAIRAERDRLRTERARINALVGSLNLDQAAADHTVRTLALYAVPDALAEHPSVSEQRSLLVAETDGVAALLDRIDADEEAIRRSEDVTAATLARINASLEVQSERLLSSTQLLRQGTISRSAFLDVQQAFTELERNRDIHLKEIERKSAERAALDSERRRIITDLRTSSLASIPNNHK